jgi:hypothetical protein
MASKLFITLPDKPFRCESCSRKFTYEPHLTADGYWLCDVCGKEVVEQADIRFSAQSLQLHHDGVGPRFVKLKLCLLGQLYLLDQLCQ